VDLNASSGVLVQGISFGDSPGGSVSLEKIRPAKESTQSKSFVRRKGKKEKKKGG